MYERYAPSVDFTPDLEHAKSMFDNDATLEYLGATITRLEPGLAEGEFTVEARHANGFGVCQGGVLFTFADALFGGACNSRRTDPTVSAQSEIIFLAPAKMGRTIRGVARERHTWGRNGLSDVTLYDGDTAIAEFRGMSRTTTRPPTGN
ncbi:hotdog fold thioesterase [Corynebacterium afermentans subsp. lipophilum]|uniref:hotdog fold thioesterase n=1 Tax=Corynebacterium afermentans TaxID=38286 RepID=UPI00188D4756|nr:hotdog fold thioesterase [Corynebacterium afermentans]MBF4547768.1 hotdog fold thioesterase [Corynebacterium afermentans subsp. lipophilum]MCG7290893.1 PaaI family thioesterase [Corynebacterium afermentans]WJY58517.1 Acyl-coenzyme A thioesterase PaaI [Corynebacterium afermentans subsp. lipophilum]